MMDDCIIFWNIAKFLILAFLKGKAPQFHYCLELIYTQQFANKTKQQSKLAYKFKI